MNRQNIAYYVVGLGWMNQTISANASRVLQRPIGATEALDFANQQRAELLEHGKVGGVPGLSYSQDFGDFASITDVKIVYSTSASTIIKGLLGDAAFYATTDEVLIDFIDPDNAYINDDPEED